MLRTETITDLGEFSSIGKEWNTLLEKANLNNPFLRHEWLLSWWKVYGNDKKLYIVRFKKGDETIGFAPLMIYKTKLMRLPIEAIGFISNHWTGMNFILPFEKELCLSHLVNALSDTRKIIIFAQMDNPPELLPLLKKILEKKRLKYSELQNYRAVVSLEGGWEDYFKKRSVNLRDIFKKKMRRLGKKGQVQMIRNRHDNGVMIKQLHEIGRNSWQGKENVNIISQPEGTNFYNEILNNCKDMLDVALLQVNDEPISYQVCVKQDGHYFAFDTAYKQQFDSYSPGMLVQGLLLQNLFNDKSTKRFDFGLLLDYKKTWADNTTPVSDMTIFPNNISGMFFYSLNRSKNLFKKSGGDKDGD